MTENIKNKKALKSWSVYIILWFKTKKICKKNMH
jgi:hypothetical protein